MTSLRSRYVPHGLLTQGAARKLACHWAMYFIPFREYPPQCILHSAWHYSLLTPHYSLKEATTYYQLLALCVLLSKTKFCVIPSIPCAIIFDRRTKEHIVSSTTSTTYTAQKKAGMSHRHTHTLYFYITATKVHSPITQGIPLQ